MLRLSVFLVFLVWTVDKFVEPEHTAAIFAFYFFVPESVPGLPVAGAYLLGLIELVIIGAFVAGYRKRLAYGAILVFHGVTTLAIFPSYLAPYEGGYNILFFASWPMFAACFALYYLRDWDTLRGVDDSRSARAGT